MAFQTPDLCSTNIYQQWYVIKSSFPAYYYIAKSPVNNPFMKVIAAGDDIEDPLYLERMHIQYFIPALSIFYQPDTTPNNPHFVIMNACSSRTCMELPRCHQLQNF